MAAACAAALGNEVIEEMPFVEGAGPVEAPSIAETILNRTWRAQLSVTGAEGLPTLEKAGNVLRPYTAVKLSLRLPPTMDAKDAAARLTEILEADAPYGCTVSFTADKAGSGWAAPDLAPWLSEAFNGASQAFYGKDMCFIGEGGSIPFMGMLGEMYPEAQFVVTGVLGPHSNPHGPNEMLHLDFTSKLIRVIALVLNAHHAQGSA